MQKKFGNFHWLLLWVTCLVPACASGPADPGRTLAGQFRLQLVADARLNLHDGRPHALYLVIMQVTDPAALIKASQDYRAVITFLEEAQGQTGVLQVHALQVQPGQQLQVDLTRLADAAFVALLAGYYHPRTVTSMILLMPWCRLQKGEDVPAMAHPVTCQAHVFLGSDHMQLQRQKEI